MSLAAGVGTRGILDMKAVLYKEQQEAEQASRDPVFAAERQSRRTVGLDVSKLKGRNQGVDQRNMQDMQHVKVQLCTPLSHSLAASIVRISFLKISETLHIALKRQADELCLTWKGAKCWYAEQLRCGCFADSSG